MNLPEFDTFEFFGLIVPGSVVLFGLVLLDPSLATIAQPAVLLVAAVVAAYILGHLVNALANMCERRLPELFGKPLEKLAVQDLVDLRYIRKAQLGIFECLIKRRLDPDFDPHSADALDVTLVKQIKLVAASRLKAEKVETFNGLVSLSRGLAVSFLVALGLCLAARNYAGAALCALAVALSVYRTRKFTDHYGRELLQTFLYYSRALRGNLLSTGSAAARPLAKGDARIVNSGNEHAKGGHLDDL